MTRPIKYCSFLFAAPAMLALACTDENENARPDSDFLKNGQTPDCSALAKERLHGIGWLDHKGTCTAVVVGSRAILTAAHCFLYTNSTQGGAKFEIDPYNHCGLNEQFQVERWVSFAKSDADAPGLDIALGMLDQSIPDAGVHPHFQLATSYPPSGSDVTLYGRGQTDAVADGKLRRVSVTYDYGTPGANWLARWARTVPNGGNLMPGDSGGPVLTPGGQVFLINVWLGDIQKSGGAWVPAEFFADTVFLSKRTAMKDVMLQYAAGMPFPLPTKNNLWPCANGQAAFCDPQEPAFLRICGGKSDLVARSRRRCVGGCVADQCVPHACEGLSASACGAAVGCSYYGQACGSGCLPSGLTSAEACQVLVGDLLPIPGLQDAKPTTKTSSDCCAGDNLCSNPPNTPGCGMTYPGGYCDPNGDGSFTDGDWTRGYNEHLDQCGSVGSGGTSSGSGGAPASSCPCVSDNRCANAPNTPGCPMTAPGGYCDPNGDGSFTDADWVQGYYDHQAECG